MENLDVLEFQEIDSNDVETEIPQFVCNNELKEFAPTMEVQAEEIKDVFLEIPELKYDKWRELSTDQRTEVLNEFEKKIAEIEMRESMPVLHEPTRPTLMGYHDGEKLVISDNLVGNNSYDAYKETLNTLFHEGRHAYQFYNLDVKQIDQSSELVDSWKKNIKTLGYEPGKNSLFSNKGFYKYYTQPVEVDARVFAETTMKKLGV